MALLSVARMRNKASFGVALQFLIAILILPMSVLAISEDKVAVMYPKVREPFDRVFLEIAAGVGEVVGSEIVLLRIDPKNKEVTLAERLEIESPSRLIALGRGGLKAAVNHPLEVPVVIGAVTSPQSVPKSYSTILLTPDPVILFEKLKRLAPHISEVSVIFHPQQKGWLVESALLAAEEAGLKLRAEEASTLKEVADIYKKTLKKLPSSCAVWIVDGRLDRAIFAEILDTAWHRKLVVFSNKSSHVKQGVLFSLYPDNTALGRSLANMVMVDDDAGGQRQLLRDVFTAVNLRTAGHLGLKFRKVRDYDLAFPPK